MFSVSNTANDILSSPELRRYLCLFFPDFMVDVIPERDRGLSLEKLGGKLTMPWGAPFMAEEMVRAANMVQDILDHKLCEFIPLWTPAEQHFIPELRKNDRSSVALLKLKGSDGPGRKPAVIICPGGAYTGLSMDGEGFQYAQRMEGSCACDQARTVPCGQLRCGSRQDPAHGFIGRRPSVRKFCGRI